MKAGEQLIYAAKKQAEGELEVHKANIEAVSYTHLTLPTMMSV